MVLKEYKYLKSNFVFLFVKPISQSEYFKNKQQQKLTRANKFSSNLSIFGFFY
jgi:hypothetical protein